MHRNRPIQPVRDGGVSKTLNSKATDADHVPRVIVLNDQGGAVMQVTVDMTATLRAQDHGHPPIVFESHGQDARYRELPEVCETISAKYGLGGAMPQ